MERILQQGLETWGLPTDAIPRLQEFSRLLLEKNRVMNLTAITDPADVARLHFLDCASLLTIADFRGKNVVDVGTGAGFPGMPLRLLEPDFDLTLLDSLGKRVDFLQETAQAMDLKRIQCVHARAEEFARQHREKFDIATSRAVAQLNILCELALPLVKVGGQFLAMKSVDSDQEVQSAKSAIAQLGGKIGKIWDYTIPGTDIRHRVVIIQKQQPTPAAYPRPFARIKKAPGYNVGKVHQCTVCQPQGQVQVPQGNVTVQAQSALSQGGQSQPHVGGEGGLAGAALSGDHCYDFSHIQVPRIQMGFSPAALF